MLIKAEGFIGTSLKKMNMYFDCSDIDDIITFQKDGTMKVVKVEAKTFIGKKYRTRRDFQKETNVQFTYDLTEKERRSLI